MGKRKQKEEDIPEVVIKKCHTCGKSEPRADGLYCTDLEQHVGPQDFCPEDGDNGWIPRTETQVQVQGEENSEEHSEPEAASESDPTPDRSCGTCGLREGCDNPGEPCDLWEQDANQWVAAEEGERESEAEETSEQSAEENGPKRELDTKSCKEYLRYNFTREEIEQMASEMAHKFAELNQLRMHRKDVIKSLDSDIAKVETAVHELAAWVKDGYQYRNIDCRIDYDYVARTKRFTRLDTYEIVKTVPMNSDELQRAFYFEGQEN